MATDCKFRGYPDADSDLIRTTVEHADHIGAWRVLHGRREIPARLREPDQD